MKLSSITNPAGATLLTVLAMQQVKAECPEGKVDYSNQRELYVSMYNTWDQKNPTDDATDLYFRAQFLARLIRNTCMPIPMYENFQSELEKLVMNRSLNDDWNCHDAQCDIPLSLKGIWGYGCWCHFGSHLGNGKGQPVNPHDAACRNMQQCLRCAIFDSEAGGYECDIKTTQYNSTLGQALAGQNSNPSSFNSGCAIQNPGDLCGTHVCTCEMQLVNEILDLVWTLYTHDPAPRHPSNPFGGTFDYDLNCYIIPTGPTELDCCGKYPFRYPYNKLDKECCDAVEVLYNPLDHICCDDGIHDFDVGGCSP